MRVLVALLLLPLAGCLSDAPQGGAFGVATVFTDCSEVGAAWPVPPDMTGVELPEGFSFVPFGGEPTGQSATMAVISHECTLFDGRVSEFYRVVIVEPSEEFRADDALHVIVLDGFTTSEATAKQYDAWGFRTEHGQVNVNRTDMTLIENGEASAGAFEVFSTAPTQEEEQPPGKARAFNVEGGEVVGAMDIDWDASAAYNGEATVFEGGVPAGQGIGWHYWGAEYGIRYHYVPVL